MKNYRTTPKAVEHYLDKKNIELFSKLGIYTQEEMKSHYDIKLEKYCQILNIEVGTMLEMVHKDIMPATFKYMNILADTEFKMQRVFSLCTAGIELMEKLNTLVNDLSNKADDLSKKHEETTAISDMMKRAHSYAKVVIPAMQAVRLIADKIEPLLGEEYKPFPSYEDLLYSVQ